MAHIQKDRGGPRLSTSADPLVIKLKLGEEEKEVKFLIDTGVIYSALNNALVPLRDDYVTVVGATGQFFASH